MMPLAPLALILSLIFSRYCFGLYICVNNLWNLLSNSSIAVAAPGGALSFKSLRLLGWLNCDLVEYDLGELLVVQLAVAIAVVESEEVGQVAFINHHSDLVYSSLEGGVINLAAVLEVKELE